MTPRKSSASNPQGEYVLAQLAKLEQELRHRASRDLATAGTQRKLGRHSHAYYHQGRADAHASAGGLVSETYERVRIALGLS